MTAGRRVFRHARRLALKAVSILRAKRLAMISRYLERVANHATNTAEMVTYMVESTMVRHALA